MTEGPLKDYRYIGNNPANYVEFNNEVWRIIGVFDVKRSSDSPYQKRIKIIRDSGIGELAMAANDDRTHWTESNDEIKDWTNSTLNFWLQTDYYVKIGDYLETGLTEKSRMMIDTAEWYLGRPPTSLTNELQSLGASDYYVYERSSNAYNNNIRMFGDVGLIYASDYGYTFGKNVSNGICYSQMLFCREEEPKLSWIYNSNNTIESNNSPSDTWTISSLTEQKDQTEQLYRPLVIGSRGDVYPIYSEKTANVRPVVYLANKIKITSGDGTKNNPYKLSL